MPAASVLRGDCLELLPKLPPESADLCYLDPPFFTGTVWRNGGGGFGDQWRSDSGQANIGDDGLSDDARAVIDAVARTRPLKNYLRFMAHRLAAIRPVLKPAGSVWLHCNDRAIAELRVLMSAIYLRSAFINQVVLATGSRRPALHKLASVNSYLLVFAARSQQNIGKVPTSVRVAINPKYRPEKHDKMFDQEDAGGRYRMVHSSGGRGGAGIKQYIHESTGFTLTDRWDDIPTRMTASEYPTQKPVELLRRIVDIASPPCGIVLDPFCGSGTAGVAAVELGRRFIGMDINPKAVELARARLAQ